MPKGKYQEETNGILSMPTSDEYLSQIIFLGVDVGFWQYLDLTEKKSLSEMK